MDNEAQYKIFISLKVIPNKLVKFDREKIICKFISCSNVRLSSLDLLICMIFRVTRLLA